MKEIFIPSREVSRPGVGENKTSFLSLFCLECIDPADPEQVSAELGSFSDTAAGRISVIAVADVHYGHDNQKNHSLLVRHIRPS